MDDCKYYVNLINSKVMLGKNWLDENEDENNLAEVEWNILNQVWIKKLL
jgi:hypothetical protein